MFIYPNPASDKIYLGGDVQSIIAFTIFQMDGKIIARGNQIEKEGINLAHLLPGIYGIQLKTDKRRASQK
ncbi:MAG: T9SS type A sorting domain-containing protein [Saprospiraceae bacterium]|nr:T9SS type A sorting domain-containing protein [Saprospiraceae bacterium]